MSNEVSMRASSFVARAIAASALVLLLAACQTAPSAPNVAPVAAIGSPVDGDTLTSEDYAIDGSGAMLVPVVGVAVDAEDGELSGASLQWSWREVGDADWTDAGTGASTELAISAFQVSVNPSLEIRLVAADADGDTSTVIIEVTLITPPI
jgi:hypothetical protein